MGMNLTSIHTGIERYRRFTLLFVVVVIGLFALYNPSALFPSFFDVHPEAQNEGAASTMSLGQAGVNNHVKVRSVNRLLHPVSSVAGEKVSSSSAMTTPSSIPSPSPSTIPSGLMSDYVNVFIIAEGQKAEVRAWSKFKSKIKREKSFMCISW